MSRRFTCLSIVFLSLVLHISAQCDCGVTWQQQNIDSVTDLTLTTNAKVLTIGVSNYMPVRSLKQAQYLCYANIYCRAVYYYTPHGSTPIAYLVKYDATAYGQLLPTADPASSSLPIAIDFTRAELWVLLRFEHYTCTSFVLDALYYYFLSGYRTQIESLFCPFRSSVNGACCWTAFQPDGITCTPSIPPGVDTSQPWVTSAIQHWELYGNRQRLSPNVACVLTPTSWEPVSDCANPRSGCFVANGLPCSGNGVCKAGPDPAGLYDTNYYCDCDNFVGELGNVDKFKGHACQYDVRLFCTGPDVQYQLCGGYNARCTSEIVPNTCIAAGGAGCDYIPFCDCDSLPLINTRGQFCEESRCGGLGCQPNLVADGVCVPDNPSASSGTTTDWNCRCSNDKTGTDCQYSAATCQQSPGFTKCTGNGICNPPGLPAPLYPLSQFPNYNNATAWCQCTAGLSFGSWCQEYNCDPTYVVAGHGICSAPRQLDHCLKPYTSTLGGTLLCDIDTCALYGGSVIGTPPSDCDCKQYQHGPDYPNDITCYPRCPSLNGVLCGSAVQSTNGPSSTNDCIQYQTGNNRYAHCKCDDGGYISVNASTAAPNDPTSWRIPNGQANQVCEFWCEHGTFAQAFQSNCNSNCVSGVCSCVCQGTSCMNINTCNCANTGFNTLNNHPRCDNVICQNGGTWNTAIHGCVCNGPYTSASNCVTNTCDNLLTTFIEGVPVANPLTPGTNKCACNSPYTYPNNATLLSCTANICGPHGTVSSTLTQSTPLEQVCTCQSGLTTVCFDHSGYNCNFCGVSLCANNGKLNVDPVSHVPTCDCVFPYTGTLCAQDLCGSHGHPGDPGTYSCICSDSFTGNECTISPCVHGTWDDTKPGCVCTSGYTGQFCDIHVQPGSSRSSSSSSSSTGMASSLSSTGASTAGTVTSSTAAAALVISSSSTSSLSNAAIGGIAAGAGAVAVGIVLLVLWSYGIIGAGTTATATGAAAGMGTATAATPGSAPAAAGSTVAPTAAVRGGDRKRVSGSNRSRSRRSADAAENSIGHGDGDSIYSQHATLDLSVLASAPPALPYENIYSSEVVAL